eukprot:gnl/TRDRNA2_/TRDRNA2_157290_c0_seq1.p1 gnl/TRDRNA2_/TRDRNA2_157290_c0~~gnl/TRDRNA2_/TRDRNA2_157290_c0_seq1.p1  ORF type:complete len:448 (+),score=86.08 gnl/TRDRNA2_/TRDRNA2_157290_c0_seq1:73-1416(+)
MVAAAAGNTGNVPSHVCYLCKRKFQDAGLLARHERLSDLHRHNTEKQDEMVEHRKNDLKQAIVATRGQIQEADTMLMEQVVPNQNLQSQRTVLEMQLRQLLGEYGQAQEMIEDGRGQRMEKKGGGPCAKIVNSGECQGGRLILKTGVATWQGNKDVQEDRYILDIELDSQDGQHIGGCAVLDGHSGSLCVDMLVDRFPANLEKCLASKPTLSEESLRQAVTEACILTDDEFLAKARVHEVLDGSTFIMALVFPDGANHKLLIANVGDSRAVLCRASGTPSGENGEDRLMAMRLSDDHKPSRADEGQRAKAKGALIDLQGVWRVCTPAPCIFGGRNIQRWGLAVSRAFGDLLLKEPERYGCPGVTAGGLITAMPEITVIEIQPNEDRFLVLACDGIWDVLGDDDAVSVCAGQAGAELAALALTRRSFAVGSDDNLTTLVMTWQPIEGS